MATTHSSQELMKFVIAAGGNLPLAAERAGVDKKELVALICGGDTTSLSEGLRAMLLLSLFDTIQQTNLAFQTSLPYMGPDAISRALSSFLQTFAALSNQPTPELNAEVADAAAAKRKILTRLEQYKKEKDERIIDVPSTSESVS